MEDAFVQRAASLKPSRYVGYTRQCAEAQRLGTLGRCHVSGIDDVGVSYRKNFVSVARSQRSDGNDSRRQRSSEAPPIIHVCHFFVLLVSARARQKPRLKRSVT